MGLDLLDFAFRIEKRFGIRIERKDWDLIARPRARRFEETAGELHEWVCDLCRRQGVKVPHSSWTRVRMTLRDVTGKSVKRIHRDTLIVRELDFST